MASTKSQGNPTTGEFTSLSVEDHIREKDMWAGTKERIATPMIVFEPNREPTQINSLRASWDESVMLSPALFKCMDEPIVNAIDQAQRCAATTKICISFNRADGRITISNNGDGIPVVRRKSTNHMYVPQFVFGVVFSGSNMKNDASSTLGGTNGIGVKITNIHSREFRIETHDRERERSFAQTWTQGMRESSDPVISPISGEGTTVSFILDYEKFKTDPAEFERIVFTRVIWAAFYLTEMLSRVHVFWNDNLINLNAHQIASVIFNARQQSGGSNGGSNAAGSSASASESALRIDTDQLTNALVIISPDAKRYTMSVINGIIVPSGNHLDYVLKTVKSATKTTLAKRLRTKNTMEIPGLRSLTSKLGLIVLWRATGVHWTSQTKDRAQFKLPDLHAALTPSDAFIARMSRILTDSIIAKLDKVSTKSRERLDPSQKVSLEKYYPARLAGTKHSAQCGLFLAEGDSAQGQVKAGISGVLSFDYYGVLSLQGVIPNARKEVSDRVDTLTNETRRERSQKLRNNEFMKTLVLVVGLDFAKKYANASERATLRYGSIIGCVDQDLDGIGNIFSMVLNLFHIFWPSLLEAGYIKRLATPIIRAYPKIRESTKRSTLSGKKPTLEVHEFYNDDEYREWTKHLSPADLARYRIRYYKGLGTHDKDEIKQIMRNMRTQMITYQNDSEADEAFEIYLGARPALRRDQLSQPPPEIDTEIESMLRENHELPSSYHLRHEAHAYQLDNLHRKINDVMGGTNQVACKILNGSFKYFGGPASNEDTKVVTLAGVISSGENYHHGEKSLEDAITRRAFLAPGGCQIPMFLQHGHFGDRELGTKGAASARYIQVRFNRPINSILYSQEDYPLLQFHIDEGKRGEPHYFVPIIPTAITENVNVPAHGWNIRINAREVTDVIANIRAMIVTNGIAHPRPMRPCCFPMGAIPALPPVPAWNDESERIICNCVEPNGGTPFQWRGYIVERAAFPNPETWSLGTYRWINEYTVQITELPLGTWTMPYIKELDKAIMREGSFIKKYQYRPSTTQVDITVTLNLESAELGQRGIMVEDPGTLSPARINDPLIAALYLREHLVDGINLMMPDESIHTFANYQEVLAFWFPVRRDYYARRIARQSEVISMWILYYEGIIRYINLASTKEDANRFTVSHMTTTEAEEQLKVRGFIPLNTAFLESPELKYEPRVASIVRGPDASYAYILNLRERDITKDGRAKYETSLVKHRAQLAELTTKAAQGAFPGAQIWLDELDALERAIVWGRETNWIFGEFGRYTYSQ